MSIPNYPKVKILDVPFKVLVLRADPDFEKAKRNEVFYEFTGRRFRGNNATSGAYAPEPQS